MDIDVATGTTDHERRDGTDAVGGRATAGRRYRAGTSVGLTRGARRAMAKAKLKAATSGGTGKPSG